MMPCVRDQLPSLGRETRDARAALACVPVCKEVANPLACRQNCLEDSQPPPGKNVTRELSQDLGDPSNTMACMEDCAGNETCTLGCARRAEIFAVFREQDPCETECPLTSARERTCCVRACLQSTFPTAALLVNQVRFFIYGSSIFSHIQLGERTGLEKRSSVYLVC